MPLDKRWSHFKVTADLAIPVRQAYEAWTTRAGLESWFLREAHFFTVAGRKREPGEMISKDDTYAWRWHGWPDSAQEKGRMLETNGKDYLKFSFTGDTIVSVFISRKKEVTLIDLVQEGIPLVEDPDKNLFIGCQMGWLFYLTNLKSVYQGGLDLRNKREDIMSSFK